MTGMPKDDYALVAIPGNDKEWLNMTRDDQGWVAMTEMTKDDWDD